MTTKEATQKMNEELADFLKKKEEVMRHFSVYTEDHGIVFANDVSAEDAIDIFNSVITSDSRESVYMAFADDEFITYDSDTESVSVTDNALKNQPANFESLGNYIGNYNWNWERQRIIENAYDYEDKFNRANKPQTISEYFEENGDFDSHDIDYAGIVTCVYPGEYDMEKPYDQYTRFVYDNVKVIRKDKDNWEDVVCDWTGFIVENINALREYSNTYWYKNNYETYDDFISEWIEQTNLMLAGHGTDTDYKNFMDTIKKHPENNDNYRKYCEREILPYALPNNRSALEKQLQSDKRELKGIYDAKKEEKKINANDPELKKAIEDYEKGREFPDNGHFRGLEKYHIIAELNDVVLGVRNTDYTYATWRGDSEYGVSGGNYMMSRDKAFEDFALRAQLIDAERYTDPEAEKEKLRQEVEDYYRYSAEVIDKEQIDEITTRFQIALDSYKKDEATRNDVLHDVIEDYETDKMWAERKKGESL